MIVSSESSIQAFRDLPTVDLKFKIAATVTAFIVEEKVKPGFLSVPTTSITSFVAK